MKKLFIFSVFASLGFATIVSACPQAIRRGHANLRIIHRPAVERQVVRERVVREPVHRERIIVREEYVAPVRERVILQQVEPECVSGNCFQEFRRVERIRSNY